VVGQAGLLTGRGGVSGPRFNPNVEGTQGNELMTEEKNGPLAESNGPSQHKEPDLIPSYLDNISAPARFGALFASSERSHGTYLLTGEQDGLKRKGQAITVPGPVTDADWAAHLQGQGAGIGVVPLLEDGTAVWGAVDIDAYDLDTARVAALLVGLGLPALCARSKSGGVHVLLFAKQPVAASVMVARLNEIAAALGHGLAECFPKQTENTEKGGNWLNMPYYGGDETTRYGVKPNGDALAVAEFLDRAEALKAANGPEWFSAPLTVTRAPQPAAPQKRKKSAPLPDEITEGQRDITLTRAAGKMRRAGFSADEIMAALLRMNQERCKPPLPDSDVQRIAKSIGRKAPAPCDDDNGLTHELAEAITATDHFARDKGAMLYHWEGGVYRPTGKRAVEARVKELCKAWQKTKAWSPELATRVEQWILVDAPRLWEQPPLDTLNVPNGLLDIAARALRPHSPDHLSAVQIAARFDAAATCPHIDRFIQDVFPDDTRHLPYEVAAWLMLPDTSIQKAVLLLGEGANGKSVWLNLLLTFLGRENVSTLSLHRIEADKFAAARLVGKLCNIGTDLPTAALAGTSMFKALTGGDCITAERKFETSFEFQPFARLLFSANSAPRSDDATHGFFRRWLVIPFNKTFDESDPATIPRAVLDARLSQPGELSGLLNRALDALPVIRQGRFTESASTRAALEEFRATTDPLAVWLDQQTVERPDAMVPKDRLRSAYAQVCQEAGRPIMPDTQFTAALKRLRPRIQTAQRRVDGKPTRVFIGLGFMSFDPVPGESALF
jgi:P4 family phage/plasmid primase-like protien